MKSILLTALSLVFDLVASQVIFPGQGNPNFGQGNPNFGQGNPNFGQGGNPAARPTFGFGGNSGRPIIGNFPGGNPGRPFFGGGSPSILPPGRRPGPVQPSRGRPNNVGGGSASQQTRPSTRGCQCLNENRCPKHLGQLQHRCYESDSGTGICCLDQEGIVATRFGPPDPSTAGAVSVSAASTRTSIQAGQQGRRKIEQENQQRRNRGEFIRAGTPEFGHAKFFYRLQSWVDTNNFAYELALATKDLVQRENLTPAQAQFSLVQTRTGVSNDRCPTSRPINCSPVDRKFRTIDGTCNNLRDPRRGKSESAFGRLAPSRYEDGVMEPFERAVSGNKLPNVRDVSRHIFTARDTPSRQLALLVMQHAQFMDHDLTHAPFPDLGGEPIQCCRNGQPIPNPATQCFAIEIPEDDGFFNVQSPPQRCMNFVRSMFAIPRGCRLGPAQQLNALTHWVDGSMVYGSNNEEAERVREGEHNTGRLATINVRGAELPVTNRSIDCAARNPNTPCFVAGDSRINEQPALTTIHTIWTREHNRIADQLRPVYQNPEELFQQARKIVIAEIQHITYNEWLPVILGPALVREFQLLSTGSGYSNLYDPSVDPTISNEFATIVFRFGHSLVQDFFELLSLTGRKSVRSLRETFNDPGLIQNNPDLVDEFTNGLTTNPGQRRDSNIARTLTNNLFQTPSRNFGMDLMALNVQRSRDHANPSYNDLRELFSGKGRARDFQDLSSTHQVNEIRRLQSIYENVNDIDGFPGGMSEKPIKGGILGATFSRIIAEQFRKSKFADRFFYEFPSQDGATFTPAELNEIKKTSMARVLCDNTKVPVMQPNAFVLPRPGNEKQSCNSPNIPQPNLSVFRNARG